MELVLEGERFNKVKRGLTRSLKRQLSKAPANIAVLIDANVMGRYHSMLNVLNLCDAIYLELKKNSKKVDSDNNSDKSVNVIVY